MITNNWHTNAKVEHGIIKEMHKTICETFYRGIAAAKEVGTILLFKGNRIRRVCKNTTCSEIGYMNTVFFSQKSQNNR